jgi:hypothetical protein
LSTVLLVTGSSLVINSDFWMSASADFHTGWGRGGGRGRAGVSVASALFSRTVYTPPVHGHMLTASHIQYSYVAGEQPLALIPPGFK